MPIVRPLQPGESELLADSIAALAGPLEISAIDLGEPKGPTIIAIREQEVIGCLWATAHEPFDIDVGVRQDYRGADLSYQMLAIWMRTPPRAGQASIELSVTATHHAMQKVLEFARLRNDGRNNYSGAVETARLLTFLEFSTAEIVPGLVLWLHPSNLGFLKARCETLDPRMAVTERHPFACLDVNGRESIWMPLYSKTGKGRYPVRKSEKTGTPSAGDTWLTEESFYHPAQAWVCDMSMLRGALSGERTSPHARNRINIATAAEMLARARRILTNLPVPPPSK